MLAELDQITTPSARALFALGAVRVALFPPPPAGARGAGLVGLSLRAAASGAVIHALVPAAGLTVAVLAALPAAAAWALLTTPALEGRTGEGAVARAWVAIAITGSLALTLATVQAYPQAAAGPDHGYVLLMALFDVGAAGYLGLAWWLPPAGHGERYVVAAGLAVAVAAAAYIIRPSLPALWAGPLPGWPESAVTIAAPVAAAAAAAARGRLTDGLRTAAWAALLSGSAVPVMIMAATYRVAPSADASPPIIVDALQHGARSGSAWLASDNLGGSVIALTWIAAAIFLLAASGALIARAATRVLRYPQGRAASD